FKAEKFNPDEWAEIIRQSGARYAGIAVIHHDGFGLWKSKVNRWNAGEMGPRRDLYGDLVRALRSKNLKIIATEHHMRTFGWYLPAKPYLEQARKANLDLFDAKYADFYWNQFTSTKAQFVAQWKDKLFEVIDNYRPDVLWFDGGDFQSGDVVSAVTSTLAHYYNRGSSVEVLNKFAGNKQFNFPREFGMLTFEAGRDRPPEVDRPWIDDLSIGKNSWGYIQDLQLQDAGETIRGFADRVSRGGGLLLSLAPTAAGEIPPDQRAFLREMGDWLKVNGEAIYGTRPWKIHAEGDTQKLIVQRGQHTAWQFAGTTAEDIRFTQKGGRVYAIALGWPPDGKLRIKSVTTAPKRVSMLGAAAPVKWSHTAEGLVVETPSLQPCKYAYALRIE
ncbi:MAG: alpha-L-fucosidase, partial [Bryobacterales bacterium]|nr:alpha-L-fucosidase [Bryobacterales bacterium]